MGNYSSVIQNDTERIQSTISEISSANCLNTCLSQGNSLHIDISNSVINGDISYQQLCYITGASCVLKSTLDSSLIDNQTSKQGQKMKTEEDPLDFLNQLIPSTDKINQQNYQSISDEITQMISSSCQNSAEVSNNTLSVTLGNDVVNGNISLTESGGITNSQCIINNMTKNYVDNSQYSGQKSSITRESCLAGLGAFIGIAIMIVIIMLLMHGVFRGKTINNNVQPGDPNNPDQPGDPNNPEKKEGSTNPEKKEGSTNSKPTGTTTRSSLASALEKAGKKAKDYASKGAAKVKEFANRPDVKEKTRRAAESVRNFLTKTKIEG
jgi:hypothetical protein